MEAEEDFENFMKNIETSDSVPQQSTDETVKDIDSFLQDLEDTGQSQDTAENNGTAAQVEKNLENCESTSSLESPSKSISSDKPVFHSTPIRSTPPNVQDDLDYSLLELDEDDEYHTVSIDQLLLDYSLLEEENEDESTLIAEETVIENKKSDSNDQKRPVEVALKENEPKAKKAKVEKAPVEKPKTPFALKQEYYQSAMSYWKKTTPKDKLSLLPNWTPRFQHLSAPVVHRSSDKSVKNLAFEQPDEWADKYHPMWEEYRRIYHENPGQFPSFIHSKWGNGSRIDITRNLTRFSRRRSNKKMKKSGKAKSSNELPETATDDTEEGVDDKNILEKMFKSVDQNSGNKESDSNKLKHLKIDSGPVAGCNYCRYRCHCSPGKRVKIPYHGPTFRDKEVKKEDLIDYNELKEEVRSAINTQMHNELPPEEIKGQKWRYQRMADNVIQSAEEFGGLLERYGSNRFIITRDQVRELVSVELTQDKYNQVYKISAYEGTENTDDEVSDAEDTTNDDEVGREDDSDEGEKA